MQIEIPYYEKEEEKITKNPFNIPAVPISAC